MLLATPKCCIAGPDLRIQVLTGLIIMKYAFSKPHFAGLTLALVLALLFAYSGIFATQPQSMQNSKEMVLAASAHAVELTDKPVRVELVSEKGDKNASLGQMLESLPASRSVYLELTGLHAVEQPGTLFHLYLDLPEDVTPKPGNAWHLGSVNFYNAVASPDAPKDKPTLPISIDITGAMRKLLSSHKLTSANTITIAPTRALEADSRPMIGQIAIVVK